MSDEVTGLGMGLPVLHLPQHDLDHALGCLEAAERQLQAALEVQWQSAAADRFRGEVSVVINDVRHVRDRALDAEGAWHHFRMTAQEYGQ